MAAYGSYGLEESAQDGELEERVERHFLHKTGCNARWERWVEECGAAAAAAVRGAEVHGLHMPLGSSGLALGALVSRCLGEARKDTRRKRTSS